MERPGRLTFKRSDVAAQHQDKLVPGAEVMVSMQSDGRGGEAVVGLAVLAPGTLASEQVSPGRCLHTCSKRLPPKSLGMLM